MQKKAAELERLNGVYMNLLRNSGVEVSGVGAATVEWGQGGSTRVRGCCGAALVGHSAGPSLVPLLSCSAPPPPPLAPQYIEGRGTLLDAHTVDVGGRRVTARNILIATGARAFVPKFEGSELCEISDHALEVPEVPRRVAIIGGGYIAGAPRACLHAWLRARPPRRGRRRAPALCLAPSSSHHPPSPAPIHPAQSSLLASSRAWAQRCTWCTARTARCAALTRRCVA